MKIPTIKLVYDRRKKANNKTEGPIELRITYQRVQRFMATGIKVLPRHWKDGHIVNRLDAFELQNALDMFVTRARKVINDKMLDGSFDIASITNAISGYGNAESHRNVPSKRLVVDFMRERAEVRKFGKEEDSQKRYDRFINWFENWGVIVTFDDITDRNIIAMDHALDIKNPGGMKEKSKWHNYHRFLNAFILDAKDAGLIDRNPYKSIKIGKGDDNAGIEKYLTKVQFDKLAKLKLPTKYLEHARDLFLFQTYTCMAYVDLEQFDAANIKMVNGMPMYFGNRGKTNVAFSFLLVDPAMKILKKYKMRLPIMSNQKYNQQLKNLAVIAGLSQNLSSHWARHTGATLLLNSGVDMEIVSRILGHSSTKMTREVYAKMLDSTIADAMAKVKF